jgi:predicted ATPase/class 3 adenylate cyclase/GAF domain-containing protein
VENLALSRERVESFDLLGYNLTEQIFADSHFVIYRGVHTESDAAVIIKATSEDAGSQEAAWLEREFELTRRLVDPGVVCAQALERDTYGSALVFSDSQRISLSQYIEGRELQLLSFFEIAAQLAEIVGRVHAQNIIHKDLKPRNIIIDPQTLSPQLTDFGIAADLARETASNLAPDELEGTLAYIAPEQTGRMNRSIDGRSDLYSLGVTFYEMLTHRLPFETKDPAELVHQHIARVPESPHELDAGIPIPLSDLVMKLVAKDPEDRYQSAFGLAHDLRLMKASIAESRSISDIQIGKRDVSDRLLLPERLYGRDEPLQTLMRAVQQASQGRAQLIQVRGHSGVGKSAMVREVMGPVGGRHGNFVSGKFDLLNRNTPYSAIVEPFEDLARMLLTESVENVERWRSLILDALGGNAQVILDVIPGFEHLLGKQPPVAELGHSESQFRFNLMFRRFLRAIATNDQPLVLFLDDLQWVDGASLALIEVLMSDADITNFVLIGSYRDNEVKPGHPLLLALSELERVNVPGTTITLSPLESGFVCELIAAALRVSNSEVSDLATLVTAKTGGNPFFVRQFLKTLSERGLLIFDSKAVGWRWDLEQIKQEHIADNVVDLVARRIQDLEPETQRQIQYAASIGNRFDLHTLAVVCGKTVQNTAGALTKALQQEILVPIGEAYKYVQSLEEGSDEAASIFYRFSHDRLQQAAYSTIAEVDRPEIHERIGRLILEQTHDKQSEERLFEIANHLNLAVVRLESVEDKMELARLNLRAGQKAKASTAYDAALDYLSRGANLLGEAGWDSEPELCFRVNLERAEAYYLSGQFAEAEALAERLLSSAESKLNKVQVLDLLILKHTTALQYGDAIDDAVRALALLGEKVPRSPTKLQLLVELAKTKLATVGKTTADLKVLPRMQHADKLAAMRVLMLATPPAYFDDPNLMPYLALRMVRLSIKYGNANHSAYGYIAYGIVLCGVLNDMRQGLAYGRLALDLVEDFDAQDIKGKVMMVFGGFITHWSGKLTDSLPLFLHSAAASLDVGDLEFHGYSRYAHASYSFFSGMPLERVADLLADHIAAVREHKHEKTDRIMQMVGEAVRDLRGSAAEPRPDDEQRFDIEGNLELWATRDRQALAYYYKYQIAKQFMVKDYYGCVDSAKVITRNEHTVMGMVYIVWSRMFEALALIALVPDLKGLQRQRAMWRIRATRRIFHTWSRYAPDNYSQKSSLVDAEYWRVSGRPLLAERAYESAIQLAHKNGHLQDEALALELVGEFQLSRGIGSSGSAYLKSARDVYRRWGAHAWADHIEQRYPEIFGDTAKTRQSGDSLTAMHASDSHGLIDVATITNAARAISEKVFLEDVMSEVVSAAVVNAGATRGVLLLAHGNELLIHADTEIDEGATALEPIVFSKSGKVPASIINYSARSHENVVLDDAPHDAVFSDDPYINNHKPLSVLCTPLLDKGKFVGILYLENSLARGAFTLARTKILEVLAAQAAISLENARLYEKISEHAEALELKVKERTQELEDAYGKLNEIFGRYVPKRVAQAVVAGRGILKPTKATATILYSDIESFTTVAEHMSPEKVVQMLNEYFPAVIEPIERNGGVVNQFQGDAMLVTFNVPVADPQHAEKALKTAIEIQEVAKNRKFAGVSLRTRIGINTGEVIAGNIGSGDRMNYTVHGDAVNLAARIEQLNKEYGELVLVSGSTVALIENEYPLTRVGEVTVRGKTNPVKLFRLAI